jgi:hypothetical protein
MLNKIDQFPREMVQGCEAAIDAGVFYQDPFRDAVVKHMGGFGCKAVQLEEVEMSSDDFSLWSAEKKRLEATIASAQRGHYALLRTTSSDSQRRPYWKMYVSDGSGKLAVGGQFDTYDSKPKPEKVLERMVGYEIYCCRKVIEQNRYKLANFRALKNLGLSIGREFSNYRHPSEVKPYSKAVISEVYLDSGQLKLLMTRRGSRRRWEVMVGAVSFANSVGLAEMTVDQTPFVVVAKEGELF